MEDQGSAADQQLQPGGSVAAPQIRCDFLCIAVDAEVSDESGDVLHITGKKLLRSLIESGIDGLREVDDHRFFFPVEDVVWGEISVDPMMKQEQLHIVEQSIKQDLGLLRIERKSVQHRRGALLIADVSHQDRRPDLRDRLRNIGSGAAQQLQRLGFMPDPLTELGVAPASALAFYCPQGSHVGLAGTLPSALVHGVVLEAAHVVRAVDFGRQKMVSRVGMCFAAEDRRFFAALDLRDHVRDPAMLLKRLDVGEEAFLNRQLLVFGRDHTTPLSANAVLNAGIAR